MKVPVLWAFPDGRMPPAGMPWEERRERITRVIAKCEAEAIKRGQALYGPAAKIVPVGMPAWSEAWLKSSARWKSIDGGRGSGKTVGLARCLVLRCRLESLHVACCREFQKSLDDSAKKEIEKAIYDLGVGSEYTITDREIRHRNGSRIFFVGLERNRESIRGWHDVRICWVEEAERLSTQSAELLGPSVRGIPSEIWFSYNRTRRTDWVDLRFQRGPRPRTLALTRNWERNPWFTRDLDTERTEDLATNPAKYPWKWNGEPDDSGAGNQVLPYDLLRRCVEAYRRGLHEGVEGPHDLGLDIADNEAGGDWNAYARRRGPTLLDVRRWRSRVGDSVKKGHRIAIDHNCWGVWYDQGGVGAGGYSYFNDLRQAIVDKSNHDPQVPIYTAHPIFFGEGVKGPDKRYSQRAKNKDFFARRNIQMAWGVRLRAMRTERLMDGEDVDPLTCLFIPPDLPDIEGVLAELSQPTYMENPVTGKLQLDKTPDGEPSPDRADAVFLAYARDSTTGLREPRPD